MSESSPRETRTSTSARLVRRPILTDSLPLICTRYINVSRGDGCCRFRPFFFYYDLDRLFRLFANGSVDARWMDPDRRLPARLHAILITGPAEG